MNDSTTEPETHRPYSIELDLKNRIAAQKKIITLYEKGYLRISEDWRLAYNVTLSSILSNWESTLDPYLDNEKKSVIEKNTACEIIEKLGENIPSIPGLRLDNVIFEPLHHGDVGINFEVIQRKDVILLLDAFPPVSLMLNHNSFGMIWPECKPSPVMNTDDKFLMRISPVYYRFITDMEFINWWSIQSGTLVEISTCIQSSDSSGVSKPCHSAEQISRNYFCWSFEGLPCGQFEHEGTCLEYYTGEAIVFWSPGEDYRNQLLKSCQYFVETK